MKTRKNALVLMGIKHCGKSTQGRLLAKHFSCPFFDTDDEVTGLTGKTPRELYSQEGAQAFMEAEARVCQQLAERFADAGGPAPAAGSRQQAGRALGFSCVIATGGGICNNGAAIAALSQFGRLVFLHADEKLAADRIVREARTGPDGSLQNLPAYIAKENPQSLEDVRAAFHRFYTDRVSVYKKLCGISVEMQALPPEQNMHSIINALLEAATPAAS